MTTKNCSKCGMEFECCMEQMGCWCEEYRISKENLKKLKEQYSNCLCPACLSVYLDLL